jgi:hypothetical protein
LNAYGNQIKAQLLMEIAMQNITKTCADSLRTFINENYGIKLKSTHAHELVAAFFGYKSKNALLADSKYPISNLHQAKIIIMASDDSIEQRREDLEGLPSDLPDSYALGEGGYAALFTEEWWSSPYPPFRSFEKAATFLAEERLQQHIGHLGMNASFQWLTRVEIEELETEVCLRVEVSYPLGNGKLSRYGIVDICLPRIAGHIGYGAPKIVPTFYSGNFRNHDLTIVLGEQS